MALTSTKEECESNGWIWVTSEMMAAQTSAKPKHVSKPKLKAKEVPRIQPNGDLLIPDSKIKPVEVQKDVPTDVPPVKACDRDGDKGCVYVIGKTTDAHGCQNLTGFTWDEGSGTCRIDLYIFGQPEPVTCSPLGKPDENGMQHAICYYKPVPPKGVAQ